MSEIDDIKRRAGIVTESVIYSENPDDPENPDIRVNGLGIYKLKDLKKNVQRKISDLNKMINSTDDNFLRWEQVGYMINHAAMQEMVKTIIAAEEELHGKDQQRH